jgi:hypothetical protein
MEDRKLKVLENKALSNMTQDTGSQPFGISHK